MHRLHEQQPNGTRHNLSKHFETESNTAIQEQQQQQQQQQTISSSKTALSPKKNIPNSLNKLSDYKII
jgi:hypothetical protein